MDIWTQRQGPTIRHERDVRDAFDVDYARVIHSTSFRRLQGKTQIHNIGDGDFYRTRLTHSLEVAQIAGGVTQYLEVAYPQHPACPHLPSKSLIQTAGFGHDLGHPPFGHGGETTLNYCMREAGGFEGNGQTLRLLSRLEHFSDKHGSNLTRRSLLALLKYPAPYSLVVNPKIAPRSINERLDQQSSQPPKCYLDTEADVVDWILQPLTSQDRDVFQSFEIIPHAHGKPRHKSLDCSIMDVSDDIAYGVHDLEDAIALHLISEEAVRQYVAQEDCQPFLDILQGEEPGTRGGTPYEIFVSQLFGPENNRKRLIGRLVNHFITHVEIATMDELREPLIRYRAVMEPPQAHFLEKLKNLVWEKVICSSPVQDTEHQGQRMVLDIFDALQSRPEQLPPDRYADYKRAGGSPRIICDYVAGMTDHFLIKAWKGSAR